MSKLSNGVTAIATSEYKSFAIKNGRLYAWGANGDFHLGHSVETSEHLYHPTQIGEHSDWEAVCARDRLFFGIRRGELYVWGFRNNRKTGLLHTPESKTPFRVGERSDWSAVSIGRDHVLGIAGGQLFAWGENYAFQLGLEGPLLLASSRILSLAARKSPVQVGEFDDWTHVSAGTSHSLAIRNGNLYAWGSNRLIGVGSGDVKPRTVPTLIEAGGGWTSVRAGCGLSYAIKDRALFAWGDNHEKKLLSEGKKIISSPTRVSSRVDVTSVCIETVKSFFISNGAAFHWRSDPARVENDAMPRNPESAIRVDDSFDWEEVSSANTHTLAIKSGQLFSWGSNIMGQLGSGDTQPRTLPTLVNF